MKKKERLKMLRDDGYKVNRRVSDTERACVNCKYGGISSEIEPAPYFCLKGVLTDPYFICDLYKSETRENKNDE